MFENMLIIRQLGIILGFTLAGEIFIRLVPGGLPASVMGMIFMLVALGFKLLKPKHISDCADFMSGIMAFFFLPAIATLIQNYSLILPSLWQLIFIATVCTFFTFFVTYGTVRLLRILLNRGK
jgi:holin-like protein